MLKIDSIIKSTGFRKLTERFVFVVRMATAMK